MTQSHHGFFITSFYAFCQASAAGLGIDLGDLDLSHMNPIEPLNGLANLLLGSVWVYAKRILPDDTFLARAFCYVRAYQNKVPAHFTLFKSRSRLFLVLRFFFFSLSLLVIFGLLLLSFLF